MNYLKLTAAAIAVALSGCDSPSNETPLEIQAPNMAIATWNLEHLAYPADQGCKPRSQSEIAELKDYAASLNADVIALQEVASKEAVAQLFPSSEWQIIMSERADSESYDCRKSGFKSTQQKVAFAVRKALSVSDVQSHAELALNNPGLRHGLEISVTSEFGELTLLNVHMKSGCFVDNYARADKDACATLAQQAPILDNWIEEHEKSDTPYIVLGDFNHRLSASYNQLTRDLTTNSDGSTSSLEVTTKDMIGCHLYYPAPIDHILLGKLSNTQSYSAPKAHNFADMNPDAMLSDHCAVSLTIEQQLVEISPSVKWHTTSKEYQLLARSIYQDAANTIKASNYTTPWAVRMEVDETVVDNSGYQLSREKIGESYSRESWNEWVKQGQATLVPGAQAFIDTVIQAGGKVFLVTNRERALDEYTWQNLLDQGLEVSVENTCLAGRNQADKDAINGVDFINDKDLRRHQISTGELSCHMANAQRSVNFGPHKLVMQVGDNIKDYSQQTQQDADVDSLLKPIGTEFILIPNSMYGSW